MKKFLEEYAFGAQNNNAMVSESSNAPPNQTSTPVALSQITRQLALEKCNSTQQAAASAHVFLFAEAVLPAAAGLLRLSWGNWFVNNVFTQLFFAFLASVFIIAQRLSFLWCVIIHILKLVLNVETRFKISNSLPNTPFFFKTTYYW